MHQSPFRRTKLLWLILIICISTALVASLFGRHKLPVFISLHRLLPETPETDLRDSAPACRGYRELASQKFLDDETMRWSLCQTSDGTRSFRAYSLSKGRFPLCRLSTNLSQSVVKEVSAAAVPLELHNEATNNLVKMFGYTGDSISQQIAQAHNWEAGFVGRLVRIALGLSSGSSTGRKHALTFLDVGSNIGVYSLSAREAGLTTVAVDANLRNLVRMRLSAGAMRWPTNDPDLALVWAYFSDRVSLRYLSFPEAVCNVGGAGGSQSSNKDGGLWVADTVPVMTATGDDLLPLLVNKLVVAKIDIETSENIFLRTGKRLFDERTVAVAQMEWWRPDINLPASSSPNYSELVEFFLHRNYSLLSAKTLQLLDPWNFYDWDTLWVRKDYLESVLALLT